MDVKPEYFVAVGLAAVIAYFLLVRRRTPKEKSFRCGRCSAIAEHTPRTINAWRGGKSKFFCNSCHARWVQSHPRQRSAIARDARSGCLGMLACLLLVPIALVLGWLYA